MKLATTRLQAQLPIFTAALERSITLLLKPHAELASAIDQELQDNPLLEAEFQQQDDGRINALLNLPPVRGISTNFDEEDETGPILENSTTLEDHLFKQLYWEVSDNQDRQIGEFIIGNLDRDGFLQVGIEEIAHTLGIQDIERIKKVLQIIQHFDPVGIATQDFKESLLVQLGRLNSTHGELAMHIIQHYLDDLAAKRYALLAKKLFVPLADIHAAIEVIISLDPKPARNYQPVDTAIYVEPDLYVRQRTDGAYYVETNQSGLPRLHISAKYQKLLHSTRLSKEDRQFIKDKINAALQFMKNLQQRGTTLSAIGNYILEHQLLFLTGEAPSTSPMMLKDVAGHLGRNESTISRAISHKYMDTPQGIFPLKFFFCRQALHQQGKDISTHSVKQELAQLIEEENKRFPLSDLKIQEYFRSKGIPLSRRTVTKYRLLMEIPPSHLRR